MTSPGFPPIQLRFLRDADMDDVHRVLAAAFADYLVEVHLDRAGLARLFERRGVRLDRSVAAFASGELVGVMAVATGDWDGRPAAYNAITGVLPTHRGRGVAQTMVQRAAEQLAADGVEHLRLEVIQGNAAAEAAYRAAGFSVARELICLSIDPSHLVDAGSAAVHIEEHSRDRLREAADWWEWTPSWQNGIAALMRADDALVVLGARDGPTGDLVGVAALDVASADLPQFVVHPGRRRQGVGTGLLDAAARVIDRPFRIINVDARATADLAFLARRGAVERLRQWEMVLPLVGGESRDSD